LDPNCRKAQGASGQPSKIWSASSNTSNGTLDAQLRVPNDLAQIFFAPGWEKAVLGFFPKLIGGTGVPRTSLFTLFVYQGPAR
jgi:hypothetical protein